MLQGFRTASIAVAAAIILGATPLFSQGGPPAGAAPQAGGPPAAVPGAGGGGRMRQQAKLDFADNNDFTSLFDGTLKGWDFDTSLWDIKDGAIHIAASCEKPTGTVYAITTAGEFGDFILKYEMKGTGNINGGMQFRSYVAADPAMTGTKYPPRRAGAGFGAPGGAAAGAGAPGGAAGAGALGAGAPGAGGVPAAAAPRPQAAARPPACANPGTPPARSTQAKWDMAGPQADFDRNNMFSGMNYEQGGRGIMATPGFSLITETGQPVKAIAQLADKATLDSWFNKDEWNQFIIVCRGNSTSIYMNGHLVTQLIDNDTTYFRNSGKIGIESESTGDLWTRNISIKKL